MLIYPVNPKLYALYRLNVKPKKENAYGNGW
jgi:hypothetical protein